MAMDLKSMAVTMPEVAGHPNRAAFRGVLTMVDVPSERAPSGAKGHRVILTKKAAEAALPSLLGMGVDYSPALDRHDVRRKVGIITRAEIVGRSIELGGYLFARDFPEIVEEIARSEGLRCNHELASRRPRRDNGLAAKGSSCQPVLRGGHKELRSALRNVAAQLLSLTESLRSKDRRQEASLPTIRAETHTGTAARGLGMSYEVTDVQLADQSSAVWILEKVTFTGAAILRKDKAAYQDTWIELA